MHDTCMGFLVCVEDRTLDVSLYPSPLYLLRQVLRLSLGLQDLTSLSNQFAERSSTAPSSVLGGPPP